MAPASLGITSCEPAFAHFSAPSPLIGFSRFFVHAQAESNTYPSTETLFCCPCKRTGEAHNEIAATPTPTANFAPIFISPPRPRILARPRCEQARGVRRAIHTSEPPWDQHASRGEPECSTQRAPQSSAVLRQ